MLCRDLHFDQFRALPAIVNDFIYLILENGIYWVIGFFVISGYCIHQSVERLTQSGRFTQRFYLLARLTRVLPLYYIALLFTVVAEILSATARPPIWTDERSVRAFLCQVFGVQNLTQTFGSFGPSWSITNELFYYLLYGFLIWLTGQKLKHSLSVGMALCIVGSSLMQLLYASILRTPAVLSLGLLLGLGINWFLGAIVASHSSTLLQSRIVRIFARAWLPLLGLLLCGRFLDVLPSQPMFLLLGIIYALMLLNFLDEKAPKTSPLRRESWSQLARLLGLASYPTYLFHGGMIVLSGSLIIRFHLSNDWRLTWAILTSVGIGSGILLGLVLEKPIMAWRATFLQKLKTSSFRASEETPLATLSRSVESMEPTS